MVFSTQASETSVSGSLDEIGNTKNLSTDDQKEKQHNRCVDVKVFLVLMCLFSVTQGFAINGINNVNIPMYERRFGLSSKQTGLEASFYDIIAGCTVLMAGYFGTQFHQPRLLGLASLCLAFGSLSLASPHFMTGEYQPVTTESHLCSPDPNDTGNSTICENGGQDLSRYLGMLLFGQGLHGLAGTVLYSIAPAFIDGSVSAKSSPAYLGIFYGSSALGPAIGYVLGGTLLNQYVDTPKSPPNGLTPDSPAWVGAWWIGFLASFTSCFLLSLPIFFFPRVLPGTEERRKNNVSQAHDHSDQHKAEKPDFGVSIRDMPTSMMILLKNPAFVCQCLISSVEGFLLSGLSTFLPKFIANQYNQTNSWAAMLTGFIAVPGAAFGQFIGGVIVRKFRLKVRGIIRFNMACTAAVILLVAVFWAKCEQGAVAGVTVTYTNNEPVSSVNLADSCNNNCGCDKSTYSPVCLDGIEYFTPCHAGCLEHSNTDTKKYVNCSCAMSQASNTSSIFSSSNETINEAVLGKCKSNCKLLYVFIPVVFLALLGTFMMAVPGTTIILRSVNDKQRTFAISMQQMCMRFIGTIPGPLVFGYILDQVCIVWQEKCGSTGSCWVYNSNLMGQHFFIMGVCVKAVTLTLLTIAYCLYKPPATDAAGEDFPSVTKL